MATSKAVPPPTSSQGKDAGDGGAPALDSRKDDIAQLSEISKNSQTTFLALVLACAYSFLTIATTTDAALLSNANSTALPLLQANVPMVWFYYVAPFILTVLFVYFHLYLNAFWRGIARLPLESSDGRGLDDYIYPWLISSALIRGQVTGRSRKTCMSARLEAWISIGLGWGMVPFVLVFYWGRYVVAHDWFGTGLHVALVLLATAAGLASLTVARNALARVNEVQTAGQLAIRDPSLRPRQYAAVFLATVAVGCALVYLSGAAFYSAPASECSASARCDRFHAALAIWRSALKQEPHADVKDVRFIPRPANWL